VPYLARFSTPAWRRQRLALMLLLCGAGSVGLYALLTLRYSLEQHVLLPLATLGTLSHYAPAAALLYALGIVLLAVFYLGGAWATRHAAHAPAGLSERSAQIIIIFPIVAMLILLHLYPITSLASINQAIQARVLTVHHANPYLVPAARFPNDPFTTYDDAQNLLASSGPLWLLLSAAPALLAGNNLLALVLLEKLLPILFVLGCQRLVWVIATRTAPHHRWQALLLFSWNPLLLLEAVGNGHSDIALLCFVLLACHFLLAGPRWLALPALALALLVNMLALILVPFFLVALWRRAAHVRQALLSCGLGSALALALLLSALLPFGGLTILPRLFQPFTQYAWSLPTLLYSLLQPLYGATLADLLAKVLAGGSFFVVALALLERFIRHTSPHKAYEQSFDEVFRATLYEGMFWFLVLGAVGFTPWMTLWLLPFAALAASSPWPWVRTNTLALSSLLAPLLLIFGLSAALTTGALDAFTIQTLAILSLFVPVLLVCSLELFSYRRKLLTTLAAREAELHRLHYQLGLSNTPAPSHLAQPANRSRSPEADTGTFSHSSHTD
jgi:hypothetical protein